MLVFCFIPTVKSRTRGVFLTLLQYVKSVNSRVFYATAPPRGHTQLVCKYKYFTLHECLCRIDDVESTQEFKSVLTGQRSTLERKHCLSTVFCMHECSEAHDWLLCVIDGRKRKCPSYLKHGQFCSLDSCSIVGI